MSRSSKKGPWVEERLMDAHRVHELLRLQDHGPDLVARLDDLPRDGRPHHRRPRRAQARARVRRPSRWSATSSASSRRRAPTAGTTRRAGCDEPRPEKRRARRGERRAGRRPAAAQDVAAEEAGARSRRPSRSAPARRRPRPSRRRPGRRGDAASTRRPPRPTAGRSPSAPASPKAERSPRDQARGRAPRRPRAGAGKATKKPPARPPAASAPAAATPSRRVLVVRAQAKYVRTSARKARLVCDHIRGKDVAEARAILAFTPRAAAEPGASCSSPRSPTRSTTTSWSARSCGSPPCYADEGPTLKRFRPRAMGRATRIRKRTSHLTITLTPKES